MPSPRDVPTYDHKPEMSARGVTEAFVRHWRDDAPGFAIINFANADMVGHTGSIPAAVQAIETVDACLGELVAAVHERGGACVVTADHGNADHMLEPDGSPNTAHSLNPVPLVVTVAGRELAGPGILADVAPTVLALLGEPQPAEMTGSLAAMLNAPRARREMSAASTPAVDETDLSDLELRAWRGLSRAHAALAKRLDGELETAHGLGLSSYEVPERLGR